MIVGIKECHIKKFSRLVQELEQLRKDIEEYCPDVVFRLADTSLMEIGIDSDDGDYPYIVQERLYCESINDVGSASYCLVNENREKELAYSKNRSRSKKGRNTLGNTTCKKIRIKKGSERYKEEVYPYWNGYRNGHGDLTEEQFALLYLDIELYD
jgi:hypothetical protein